jgi:hypothetical protein
MLSSRARYNETAVRLLTLASPILCAVCVQAAPQFVWQGEVDGVAILHLQGKKLQSQIQEGGPLARQQYHFSDRLPDVRLQVRVEVLKGRGYVHVVDQPSGENQYTLAVAIEDQQPGSAFYSIALYWDTSDNAFRRDAEKIDKVTWSGRVIQGAIVSCHAKSCDSSAEQGAPSVSSEHYKFSKPLPAHDSEVSLEDPEGRGEIRLIEQPRERNGNAVKVAIRDPGPGAGDYAFTLVWNRPGHNNKETGPILEPTGRGFLWRGKVDGRIRVAIQGGASFSEVVDGERIGGEHGDMYRQLPARSDLMPVIRKLQGRGNVAIIELPSEKNSYRLVFEIDDPEPGADDYEVELDW